MTDLCVYASSRLRGEVHVVRGDGATGALDRPHHVTTDPSNRLAWVPCMRQDTVLQLRFDDRTGRFGRNAPADIHHRTGAGPRHMAHHPSGKWAYLVNQHHGWLVVCGVDRTSGQRVEIARGSALPDGRPPDHALRGRAALLRHRPHQPLSRDRRGGHRQGGWPERQPLLVSYAIDPETGAFAEWGRAHCGDGIYWVEIVDLP